MRTFYLNESKSNQLFGCKKVASLRVNPLPEFEKIDIKLLLESDPIPIV